MKHPVKHPVTAIVIGCGSRGNAYAAYSLAHPDQLKIVGAVDPDAKRLKQFVKAYCDQDCKVFSTWQQVFELDKFADCVFLCTLDTLHTEPAIKALEGGYDVLLEKPMSINEQECRLIVEAAQSSQRVLTVCHVLRYTPFYQTIKRVIQDGLLGDVVSIDQIENVANWHQAHSFVRGNWRNSEQGGIMVLQKSCHDLDIILYLMDDHCTHVSSFGALSHFTKEHAPLGAPLRCLDGCPHEQTCPYFAPRIYLTQNIGWPTDTISTDLSYNGRLKALQEGPYGRCVYHCDNNVVDHQVVNMEFSHGQTASFTMTGFTTDHGRQLKIFGTKAQLEADMLRQRIVVTDFLTETPTEIEIISTQEELAAGHGGGDNAIVRDFLLALEGDTNLSSAKQSLESHLMCFAAERSRLNHTVESL